MQNSTILKQLLHSGETLVMPDAYDPISAKIIEHMGFKAVQCSGYSFAIAKCYQNENQISIEENLALTENIVKSVDVPVMADGEDGYGDGEQLFNNIASFIKIGIAGINIEDQNLRDTFEPSRIIAQNRMLGKITSILQAKNEYKFPDFIINARTDALALDDRKNGLKIAIERGNSYLASGADLCFVPYVRNIDEVRLLAAEIKGPLSIAIGLPYNIDKITIKQCRDLGVARVSLPTLAIFTMIQALIKSLKSVEKSGDFSEILRNDLVFSDMKVLQEKLMTKIS